MRRASKLGVTQTIAFDGSTAATNPFGAQTYQVRLVANSACHVHIYSPSASESATASTSDPYLPANWETYVSVTPGQQISAIKAATNGLVTATAGTLFATEVS